MDKRAYISEESQMPSMFRFITEHTRVWGALAKSYGYRQQHGVPKSGDGHPVLFIPGLMGSDLSSKRVRDFMEEMGYVAYGWGKGRNFGRYSKDIPYLLDLVNQLYQQHGTQVTLIGWSLGGVYAREMAKAKPDYIRQVITMASPFNGITKPNRAAWVFRLLNGKSKKEDFDRKWLEDLAQPAPVPTTAIFSKEDGIVPWDACREETEDAWHQNIEVNGSHLGMGFNPAVWYILANRLPYSREDWRPMPIATQPFLAPKMVK